MTHAPHTLIQSIGVKSPGFLKLYTEKGHQSLATYYTETLLRAAPTHQELLEPALTVIHALVTERLTREIADEVVSDLRTYTLVGTADHLGPVSSPFFVYNTLTELALRREHGLRTVPIFACGNISITNSSFPRGFLYTHEHAYAHVPLITRAHPHTPAYLQPGYTQPLLERFKTQIRSHIPETVQKNFFSCFDPENNNELYTVQVTRLNHALFRIFFPHTALVHIDQESVVSTLLHTYHIPQRTWIASFLYDDHVTDAYTRFFDGIPGAHHTEQKRGSVLFWHYENGKRLRITAWHATQYVTEDGITHVHTPETLSESLRTHTLIPTMALTFLILSFYHGISCGGGFSQISYLPRMEKAHNALQAHLGWNNPVTSIQDICRGDLAFLGTSTLPDTSIDLIQEYGLSLESYTASIIQKNTIAESLERIAPLLPHISTLHEKSV